jgi:predicted Zn-dependent protease
MPSIKRGLIFLLCFIIISCGPMINHANHCDGPILPGEDDPPTSVNNYGDPLYWNINAFPIRVVIDERMATARVNNVMDAIETWNEAVNMQIFTVERGTHGSFRAENTIWITEGPIEDNVCNQAILGLTTRFYRTNFFGISTSIDHATIILSDAAVPGESLNTAVHELGHALGFSHHRELDDIMYPYNQRGRGGITQDEIEYIREMMSRTTDSLLE